MEKGQLPFHSFSWGEVQNKTRQRLNSKLSGTDMKFDLETK